MILISYRYGVSAFFIGQAETMEEAEKVARAILKQLGEVKPRRWRDQDLDQPNRKVIKYDTAGTDNYVGGIELEDLSSLSSTPDLIVRAAEEWLEYFKKNEGTGLP